MKKQKKRPGFIKILQDSMEGVRRTARPASVISYLPALWECEGPPKLGRLDWLQHGLGQVDFLQHSGALTCDLGLEGAAHDVLGATILDGNEVVARGHRSVRDHVALRTLPTVQLHLGGAIDGDR